MENHGLRSSALGADPAHISRDGGSTACPCIGLPSLQTTAKVQAVSSRHPHVSAGCGSHACGILRLGFGQSETFKSALYPDIWISRNPRLRVWTVESVRAPPPRAGSAAGSGTAPPGLFEDGGMPRPKWVCALAAIPSLAAAPSFRRTEAPDGVH